jgi:hypothetical protein
MNKIKNYILLFLGIFLSALFYSIGSYYFRYGYINKIKFKYIFLISIICGIISYLIKIPVFYFLGKKFTIMYINILFLIISFVMITIYSKFILNETIKIHTYIIFTIIVMLIVLNNYLSSL